MINRELQISQREKQEILAFEGHLAAASTKQTITESSSLLLSQLTSLDPQYGPLPTPVSQAWRGLVCWAAGWHGWEEAGGAGRANHTSEVPPASFPTSQA